MRFLTTDRKQKHVNVYDELHQIMSDDGLFTNNSSWLAEQSILHVTMTFYGDCMKMRVDFALNLAKKELAVASRQRTFFSPVIFYQQQHDYHPGPTLLT
jgi:hypothetical protein